MAATLPPLCEYCTLSVIDSSGVRCNAFPEGVPPTILVNKADHRKPYPNDKGVRFQPTNDYAARYADALFGKLTDATTEDSQKPTAE